MQNPPAIPTPATSTPPSDSLKNTLCIHCGYSLQGLPPHSACPECGTSIEHSLTQNKLTGVQDSWFTSVRVGLVLLTLSVLTFSALASLSVLQSLHYFPPLWWYTYHLPILALVLPFFGTIARWWGIQLIATRKSIIDRPARDGSNQRITRALAHIALLIAYCNYIALYRIFSFLPINIVLTIWNMALSLFMIISMWYLLRVLENIAKSMGQNNLRRHAVIIRYIMTAGQFSPLLANFLGSVLITLGFDREMVVRALLRLIVDPGTVADILSIIWSIWLYTRLYHWLGIFRSTAPSNPNNHNKPWIPLPLQKLLQLLQHGRSFASYAGHRD